MTRTTFEQLTATEQARTITRYGTFLAQRILAGDRIYLYALSSFYVELFHELAPVHTAGVRIQLIFDDPELLQPYLEEMDVTFFNT